MLKLHLVAIVLQPKWRRMMDDREKDDIVMSKLSANSRLPGPIALD